MRTVLLRHLVLAFVGALLLHAVVSFGESSFPRTMQAFGNAFGTVIVPAGVFLFVFYRSPFLAELSAPGIRIVRLFVCAACSVGLALASMILFLLLWFVVCWMFDLPFRDV